MPVGFIVDTEFVWGFQARIVGLSKTSPSFYYPPPTTFLGALAEVIAKENNVGEYLGRFIINELSKELLAIGVRPLNCVPIKYEDLNRIITIRKVGVKDKQTGKNIGILAPHPFYLDKSFDSPARGKTILSSLDENPPKLRWFLVFENESIKVKDAFLKDKIDKIELNENLFWKIHRLGSKESRVSVIKCQEDDMEEIKEGYIVTKYSFPSKALNEECEEKVRKWENEVYISPYLKDIYKRKKGIFNEYEKGFESLSVFKVPIIVSVQNPPEYIIKLQNGIKAYKFGKEVMIGHDEIQLPNR